MLGASRRALANTMSHDAGERQHLRASIPPRFEIRLRLLTARRIASVVHRIRNAHRDRPEPG